jgi:integrase
LSPKELSQLPPLIREDIKRKNSPMRISKRKVSKNGYTYELRYRQNGYNIYISDKNLEKGKERFLEKLKNAEKKINLNTNTYPTTFHSFALYYFEKYRKRLVSPETYRNDYSKYRKYLLPYFCEKPLNKITPNDCQLLIDIIDSSGKGKTKDDICSLMSVIFKSAVNHDLITKSPMLLVLNTPHIKKHGNSLSKEEEIKLLTETQNTEYQLMFAIALYTGMRPNEFETARREGNFIVCKNSKRKKGKIEYKKIPITPMLHPYIKDNQIIRFYEPYVLRAKLKSILPNHILYDMRTTFYSRCKECGIADAARDEFVGHSLGALGNAYTDLSDEYLLKEGEKFKY